MLYWLQCSISKSRIIIDYYPNQPRLEEKRRVYSLLFELYISGFLDLLRGVTSQRAHTTCRSTRFMHDCSENMLYLLCETEPVLCQLRGVLVSAEDVALEFSLSEIRDFSRQRRFCQAGYFLENILHCFELLSLLCANVMRKF